MNEESDLKVGDQIETWYKNLRSVGAMTESDSYDLKCHLLDTIDELKASGLNERDALERALDRTGRNYDYEEEFSVANAEIIMIRKIILILSGMLGFFFFYYLENIISRTMVLYHGPFSPDPIRVRNQVILFVLLYQLSLIVIILLVRPEKFFKERSFTIRPVHIMLLLALVFSLVLADFQLQNYLVKYQLLLFHTSYYSLLSYSGFSFYFVSLLCFIIMHRRSLSSIIKPSGLNKNESGPATGPEIITENKINTVKTLSIAFSGILVYLFLKFLLHASTTIFLIIMQHYKDDPVNNLGWAAWYVASIHLCLIFFTISVYFKDERLINRLMRINPGKWKIAAMVLATVILFITSIFFSAIAKFSMDNIIEYKIQYSNLKKISDLSFSFLLMLCFLFLFNKYYRDNTKLY